MLLTIPFKKLAVLLSCAFFPCLTLTAQWTTVPTGIHYSGGNVGIGTSTPAGKLSIYKSTTGDYDGTLIVDGPANSERSILFRDNGANAWWFGRDNENSTGLNDGIGFWRSNTGTAFVIKDNGNVAIGTGSPATRLDVRGGFISTRDADANPGAYLQGTTTVAYFGSLGTSRIAIGNASNWEKMTILNNGNVGINTTTPTASLDVNGALRVRNVPTGTGRILVVDVAGNVRASTQSASELPAGADTDIQTVIQSMQKEIAALKTEIASLKQGSIHVSAAGEKAWLQPNAPNPFNGSTVINYHYPAAATTAFIQITDLNGKPVKRFNLMGQPRPLTVTLEGSVTSPGTYIYSLEIDGRTVDSKKMVLVK